MKKAHIPKVIHRQGDSICIRCKKVLAKGPKRLKDGTDNPDREYPTECPDCEKEEKKREEARKPTQEQLDAHAAAMKELRAKNKAEHERRKRTLEQEQADALKELMKPKPKKEEATKKKKKK